MGGRAPAGTKAEEEERARQIAVTVAHRAAMRALALGWIWFETHLDARNRDLTACPLLWCALISGGAAKYTRPEITQAAAAAVAASLANGPGLYATFAVESAAFTVEAAAEAPETTAVTAAEATADAAKALDVDHDAARAIFWSAVSSDCAKLMANAPLDHVPLWHDAPNPLADDWADLKRSLADRPADHGWPFWIDWYQRALDGQPQDWAMLTQIALIDKEHWVAGPAAVWAQIEKLLDRGRLATLVQQTPHGYRVGLSEVTAKLTTLPVPDVDLDRIIRRLERDIDDFLRRVAARTDRGNLFYAEILRCVGETLDELRQCIHRARQDPQDLYDSIDRLQWELVEELRQSGLHGDPMCQALGRALEARKQDICIADKAVDDWLRAKSDFVYRHSRPEQIAQVGTMAGGMAEDSEGNLKYVLTLSRDVLQDPSASDDLKKAAL